MFEIVAKILNMDIFEQSEDNLEMNEEDKGSFNNYLDIILPFFDPPSLKFNNQTDIKLHASNTLN